MEKKIVQPTTVATYSLETTVQTMARDIGTVPNALEAKVIELGLEATGPQTWMYFGCDGSAEKPFWLDLAIPIKDEKGDAGKFTFDKFPEFQCVATVHKGPWTHMAQTYDRLVSYVLENGLQMTGFNREVYLLADFENPNNCETEIQIGIN